MPAGVALIVDVEITAVVGDLEPCPLDSPTVKISAAVLTHVEARTLETSAAAEMPTVVADLRILETSAASE